MSSDSFQGQFDQFIARIVQTYHDTSDPSKKFNVLYVGPKKKSIPKDHSPYSRPIFNLTKSVQLSTKKLWVTDSYSHQRGKRRSQFEKISNEIKELKKSKQKFHVILFRSHFTSSLVNKELPKLLSPGGICLIIDGPSDPRIASHSFKFGRSDRYLDKWKKEGLNHKAFFALSNEGIEPKKLFREYRQRQMQYRMEILQKKKNEKLLVAHNDVLLNLPSKQIKEYFDAIFDNYFDFEGAIDDGSLFYGARCKLSEYEGIKWMEAEKIESDIKTDVKKSKRYIFRDLIKNIKRIDLRELKEFEFIETKNNLCVFQKHRSGIDIISKSKTIEVDRFDMVFIIELENKILKDFLEIYFHTIIGKMYRSEIETIGDLRKLPIYLPSQRTQRSRIKNGFSLLEKIDELKKVLEDLLSQYSNSPSNSEGITKILERMIQETRALTKEEEIQKFIDDQMETKRIEFKDGYHFNTRVPKDVASRKNIIEEEKMRTLEEINAFLNTDGGYLIFGVSDADNNTSEKFEVIGIENDLKKYKSTDQLKNAIVNSIRDKFLTVCSDFLKYHFLTIEEKPILAIEIESYRARNKEFVYWKDDSKPVKFRSSSASIDLPISQMEKFRQFGKIED